MEKKRKTAAVVTKREGKKKKIDSKSGDVKKPVKTIEKIKVSGKNALQADRKNGKKQPPTEDKKEGSSVVLDRKARKQLTEERKKRRRPNYDLEKNVVQMWENMRKRNVKAAEKAKMASVMHEKMKGKLALLAMSHSSSRVVQMCVKFCSREERSAMFAELKPEFLNLARNTYAHHLINRVVEHASPVEKNQIIPLFYGQVVSLLRHPVGSHVVEQTYRIANEAQKHNFLSEFYSPEHRIFKDNVPGQKMKSLADVLSESNETKSRSVLEHFALSIQPIVEKGIVDHSIIHRALYEFLSCSPQRLWVDVVEQLSGPLLLRMIHTRDGAFVAAKCIAAGSAKERKKSVKALKEHVLKVAMDDHGYLVLLQIFEVVDDTLLVRKTILSEIVKHVKDLATHKTGSKVLLYLLAPKFPRYFHADIINALTALSTASLPQKDVGGVEPSGEQEKDGEGGGDDAVDEGGDSEDDEETKGMQMGVSKKDPEVRRRELLHDSQLDQALLTLCEENCDELLRSQFGTDVLYEVATGGVNGILNQAFADRIRKVQAAIVSLVNEPRIDPVGDEGSKCEHVMDQFFANRTLRRLVAHEPAASSDGTTIPSFASVLWKDSLKGKCHLWAKGHSAKVISALASCNHSLTVKEAVAELKPLAVNGGLKEVEAFLPSELKLNSEQVPKAAKKPSALMGGTKLQGKKSGEELRIKKKKM